MNVTQITLSKERVFQGLAGSLPLTTQIDQETVVFYFLSAGGGRVVGEKERILEGLVSTFPLSVEIEGDQSFFIGSIDAYGLRKINAGSEALYINMARTDAEGLPAPCLVMRNGGKFRFRLVVKKGNRSFQIRVKQAANVSPRPTLKILANAERGILSDIVGTASFSAGWVTLGPIFVSVASAGPIQLELASNYAGSLEGAPCYWDHFSRT